MMNICLGNMQSVLWHAIIKNFKIINEEDTYRNPSLTLAVVDSELRRPRKPSSNRILSH
jgi:hypothetical protein